MALRRNLFGVDPDKIIDFLVNSDSSVLDTLEGFEAVCRAHQVMITVVCLVINNILILCLFLVINISYILQELSAI